MNNSFRIQLRALLAELYPDEASMRRILADARIEAMRIALNSSAVNNWQAILNEVEKGNQLPALLTLVADEYPTNPTLQQLLQEFDWLGQAPAQPAPAQPSARQPQSLSSSEEVESVMSELPTELASLLSLLRQQRQTCYELEEQEARHERTALPLELRNQLLDLRATIEAAQARFQVLRNRPLNPQQQTLLRQADQQQHEAELRHIANLQRLRQLSLDELEKRLASYGPGRAPLTLVHDVQHEKEELASLSARWQAAQAAQLEATQPLPPSGALQVTLVTPTGERYASEVEDDLLVAQLQSAFLAEWQAANPTTSSSQPLYHYSLRRQAAGTPLEPAQTLRQAGVGNESLLYLVAEALSAESPVALIVEDPDGNRYTTAVRLDTVIRQLASAFWESLNRSGEATVELIEGMLDATRSRHLRQEATLFEERVSEGAHLRILPLHS